VPTMGDKKLLTDSNQASLKGFYIIGVGATIAGILVIMILNIATPLEFVLDHIAVLKQGETMDWLHTIVTRFIVLVGIAFLSCTPFLCIMFIMVKPISACLKFFKHGQRPSENLLEQARQRLINLPFIMVPFNLLFWILIPVIVFSGAYAAGQINPGTAMVFSARSIMVGLISSSIVFFGTEAYARQRLIPLFFPEGLLSKLEGCATLSISKRVRAFFRLVSLIPLATIVLTLWILYLQADPSAVTVEEYAWGVLVFSIVVFALFFIGSGVLNRLISRSISLPVKNILDTVEEIKKGNYDAQVRVVSNDEIGVLGDSTNEMIRGLKERELLRDAFGKYVAPEVRDEILSGRIPLDGEVREVTVLFADIRGFTPLTESNDPKRVVKILNKYFEEMAAAIHEHSGLILQFLGDEIYAVFGAPVYKSNHPCLAFEAAISMKKRISKLNKFFSRKGWPMLSHGIGIHTGNVVAANIGSPDRLSYLLVGDTVNIASRLQSLTKRLDVHIILSSQTHDRLQKQQLQEIKGKKSMTIDITGKRNKVDIYSIG